MADWPLAQSDAQHTTSAEYGGLSTYGLVVTSGAANTKGSWVPFMAALPFDVVGFYIIPINNSANAGYMIDVGVGGSGSEQVLIPNFHISPPRANQLGQAAYMPIRIKKGTRVACRTMSDSASATATIGLQFVHAGIASDPGFSRAVQVGAVTASTSGTAVNPGGTAHTKSTWANLGTAPHNFKAIMLSIVFNNAAMTKCFWKLDVGIGSGPTIVIPDLLITALTDQAKQEYWWFPIKVKSGVAIQMRASCSITDATDRVINDCIVYGFD
jgi:hypothetical protein